LRPTLSFVIPVLNDAERLRRCLRSIATSAARTDASVEVIVADNGSTDGSADIARDEGAAVLALPGLRVGELRNLAVARTSGEALAFVDADHEIVPEWIPSAIEVLADARVGAVGAPCRPPSPANWVQRVYNGLRRHETGRMAVDWLGSGNMAVRKSAFVEVGGFDTALETCEDVDFCRKLRARGLVLVSDSRLANIHHGDPQTLRQVFFGELWRGRDNVRVSLRPPRTGRTIVSAAIPGINLLAVAAAVAGVLSLSPFGLVVAGAAVGSVVLLVALRATMMVVPGGRAPAQALLQLLRDWPGAAAVAAAYEAGRALALVSRFGHERRRRGAPVRSAA
jgi:GT2 family glycosyltransferase